MKLNPGERSILASFKAWEEGHEAMAALKEQGFEAVQIDRVSHYGYDPEADRRRPVLGDATSLAATTLFGHEQALSSDSVRILLAATPEASGMSGQPADDGYHVLVTVVTDEARVLEAVAVLERFGARV